MAKLLLASLSPLSFCIEKEWKDKGKHEQSFTA
jgi:hypothetical protein